MKKTYALLLSVFVAAGMFHSAEAQWTSLSTFSNSIFDLKTFEGELFVTGGFTQRDGQPARRATIYDGSTFNDYTEIIMGSGFRNMEIHNDQLYVTGSVDFGFAGNMLAVWNGTDWISAGFSFNQSTSGIHSNGTDLFIGTDFGRIFRMNAGGGFMAMPDIDVPNNISAIATYQGELIIAGSFTAFSGSTLNSVARWDGSAWQPLGLGVDGSVDAMIVHAGELYVAGRFDMAGGQNANDIAKWDGANWSDVGGSNTGGGFNGISDLHVFKNKLYVAGDISEMGGVPVKFVAAWDGSTWEDLALPGDFFANCITDYKNKLYVGTSGFSEARLYEFDGAVVASVAAETQSRAILNVYPNPNKGIFNLDLRNAGSHQHQLSVTNLLGQQVYQETLNSNASGVWNLDLTSLGKGVYFLRVSGHEVDKSHKVVIE